jgi:hypothetical protein
MRKRHTSHGAARSEEERFWLYQALLDMIERVHDGPLFVKCQNAEEYYAMYSLLHGTLKEGDIAKKPRRSLVIVVDLYTHGGLYFNDLYFDHRGEHAYKFVDERSFPFSRFVAELPESEAAVSKKWNEGTENPEWINPSNGQRNGKMTRELLQRAEKSSHVDFQAELHDYTCFFSLTSQDEIPPLTAYLEEHKIPPMNGNLKELLKVGEPYEIDSKSIGYCHSGLALYYATKNGDKSFRSVADFLSSHEAAMMGHCQKP